MLNIPKDLPRQKFILLATATQLLQRHEETAEIMRSLICRFEEDLTAREHNVLLNAYSEIVSNRTKLRDDILQFLKKFSCNQITELKRNFNDEDVISFLNYYLEKIECQIRLHCTNLESLAGILVAVTQNPTTKVRHLGTKASCLREILEIEDDEHQLELKEKIMQQYKKAEEIAEENLSAIDVQWLVLLNEYSVFLHDFMDKPDLALSKAQEGLKRAKAELENTASSSSGMKAEMEELQKLQGYCDKWLSKPGT